MEENVVPEQPAAAVRAQWTRERIAALTEEDIKRLRDNAERLGRTELVVLCTDVLGASSEDRANVRCKHMPQLLQRRLVSRVRAFHARGVFLADARTSWGGVRKEDGAVVLAVWADAVQEHLGGCSYRLWAPNVGGAFPWAAKPAGIERLVHCRRAVELGKAEGILVYGQRIEGSLPEDKAYAIHGADPEIVLHMKVESRGAEYWAVWGARTAAENVVRP